MRELNEKQIEIQKIRAENEEKLNQSKFQKLSESIKYAQTTKDSLK